MSKGSFTEFQDALRAFESGVDATRFASGQITEAQIRGWVGDDNWEAYEAGQLSWRDLQYRSQNSLGFVGYQFGEALLIDLGYYRDTISYGNGAATNTWDGTFTGRGGIDSFEELKSPLQEGVILDAFGYNLRVIEQGLANAGESLSDYLGQTRSYVDPASGATQTVTLTLTGILAAAHLRGAWGTLDLLQRDAVSSDEYGTSILRYIDQFGGYDSLDPAALIAAHQNGTSGALAESTWATDFNGDGTIAGPAAPPVIPGGPTPPTTPTDPTLPTGPTTPTPEGGTTTTIAWSWGEQRVLDFDPATDRLDFGWFQAGQFTVTESAGSTVIAIPSNQQSYTLQGVSLAELDARNIVASDASTTAAWANLLGAESGPVAPPPVVTSPVTPTPVTPSPVEPGPTEPPVSPDGSGRIFDLSPNGPDIVGFDPTRDRLDAGNFSVHSFIVVDTPQGVGFRSPWNTDIELIQGVNLATLGTEDFMPIDNLHLREDISGALAWEDGIVEQPNTVYLRSHEVGQIDRVAFDPATDRVDMRYFATREMLFMTDGAEGVEIGNAATGQTLVLLGVQRSQLSGEHFIFHATQVLEDHLDHQLGIDFVPQNVLGREAIPTAGGAAPGGAAPGGGTMTPPVLPPVTPPGGGSGGHEGHEGHGGGTGGDGIATTTQIDWEWGARTIVDFDPSMDRLDFGWIQADQLRVTERSDGIEIALPSNNQVYLLPGIGFADLTLDDIVASDASTMTLWHDLIPHSH